MPESFLAIALGELLLQPPQPGLMIRLQMSLLIWIPWLVLVDEPIEVDISTLQPLIDDVENWQPPQPDLSKLLSLIES